MATVRLSRYEVEEQLLPAVCLQCGAPATRERRKAFSWYPPWINLLIFVGLIPFLIVALVLTKRMTMHAPFCEEHRNHWNWRSWFVWLGLMLVMFLGFGAVVVAIILANRGVVNGDTMVGLACVGTLLIGLIWLVAAAIIQQTAIRPTEITDRRLTLTNVSDYFIDALDEERDYRDQHEHHRSPRRRSWDEDEDKGYWNQEDRDRSRRRPRLDDDEDEDEYQDREPDGRYRPPRRSGWDEEEGENR
jgi:hypothetical protein